MVIKEWPTRKFDADDIKGQKECSICMEEYKANDELIHLNCHEMYEKIQR